MKKVLIVVDMQKDFLEPDGKLNLGKDTTEFKQRVAKKIQNHNGPIIATMDTHKEDSPEFLQFPPHCIEGTDGWIISSPINEKLTRALDHLDVEYIKKDSFTTLDVAETLFGYHVMGYEFEFVGVCTHICVHDNIASLYHHVKENEKELPKITVQKDLVDDFDDEMAKNALLRMERLYNVTII